MMWMICLFGGLGAMARYVLDVSIQQGWNRENRRTNRNFPLSTLVINGVASLCAGHRHDVLLFAIGGYGHGHDVRCRISRWFLNILHGAQRSGFIDSPASFYAGSGLWNSNRRGASHLCGRRFRHCAACQSGVIFTLHGRSLSNVKEI